MSLTDPDHTHWAPFDGMLEQLEFRRLDHMLRLGEPLDWEADLARLRRLAQAAGFGHADGVISDRGVEALEDGPDADYTESDYFHAIDASENRLLDVTANGVHRHLVRAAVDRIRDHYVKGRTLRIEQAPRAQVP